MNTTGKSLKPGKIARSKKELPAWKIEQNRLNREIAKYRADKITDGLAIASQLQADSEKMINTDGLDDMDDYFLSLGL